MKQILEEKSGLKCGADFKIGYSPERINPGDEAHTLDKITKIVAGMDKLFSFAKTFTKSFLFLLYQRKRFFYSLAIWKVPKTFINRRTFKK